MKLYRPEDYEYGFSRIQNSGLLTFTKQFVEPCSYVSRGNEHVLGEYCTQYEILLEDVLPLYQAHNDILFCRDLKEAGICIVNFLNIDPSPVKLGYVNANKEANYIARLPMREDWRQGIRMNNTIQLSGRVRLAMEGPNVYNTLVNDFPSYKECVSNVPSLAKSMAWHRDWCVTEEGELHYKTEGVGLINSDNGEPNLNDNFWYLREALNDSRKMVV